MDMVDVETLEQFRTVTRSLKLTSEELGEMKERALRILCSLIQLNDSCWSGSVQDRVKLAFIYAKELNQVFCEYVEEKP